MLPMVLLVVCVSRFLLLLVSKRLKSGYVGSGADADWWWFSLCADVPVLAGYIAFSIADRPGLTPV